MARNPDAEWLGEHAETSYLISRYDVLCVHTIVGYAPAHAAHFSTKASGALLQSRDTRYRSAANYQGNPRVIAVENEDHGTAYGTWNMYDGHAVPAFTDAQCETLARLAVWAHRTHGIPLVLCPDSKPTSRGIGYHRQGIDGNFLAEGYAYGGRVPGGEVWTTTPGKVCPGDRRIRQLINVIIPRARVLAGLEEDTMGMETYTPVQVAPGTPGAKDTDELPAHMFWSRTYRDLQKLAARFDALAGALSDDEAHVVAAIREVQAGQVDVDALAPKLAEALAPLLPAGVSKDDVTQALRGVFAQAAA